MGHCWRCGNELGGGAQYLFACPTCASVDESRLLRTQTVKSLEDIRAVQASGFQQLASELNSGLSHVASVLEWGFTEITWELSLQTKVLSDILRTLRAPRATAAEESREQAEVLRSRGIPQDSIKKFEEALNLNPLDYRIYVGLAHAYIQLEQPGCLEKARHYLEKSIPHSPRIDHFDYRAYSYQLIARTYYCEENYPEAVNAIEHATDVLAELDGVLTVHWDIYYDSCQYYALTGNAEECCDTLEWFLEKLPWYAHAVAVERNFDPVRSEVRAVIDKLKNDARLRLHGNLSAVRGSVDQVKEAIDHTRALECKARPRLTQLPEEEEKIRTHPYDKTGMWVSRLLDEYDQVCATLLAAVDRTYTKSRTATLSDINNMSTHWGQGINREIVTIQERLKRLRLLCEWVINISRLERLTHGVRWRKGPAPFNRLDAPAEKRASANIAKRFEDFVKEV